MPTPAEIAAWLDGRLESSKYRDSEPENGLLFDAGRSVRLLASSVNTTFDSISAAEDAGAQMLVVHHPTWAFIDLSLQTRKLDALREAGISLYCAHASLDGAAEGTGSAVARLLDISVEGRFAPYQGSLAGVLGRFRGGWDALQDRVTQRLGVEPESHHNNPQCDLVGIVTGGGGMTSWLEEAQQLGCDTYLTGEGSMFTRLFAREAELNLVLAGHDTTETPGIDELGRRTADEFQLGSYPGQGAAYRVAARIPRGIPSNAPRVWPNRPLTTPHTASA